MTKLFAKIINLIIAQSCFRSNNEAEVEELMLINKKGKTFLSISSKFLLSVSFLNFRNMSRFIFELDHIYKRYL